MKKLRESLPARVAAATAGLLALVMLLGAMATYAITALLLRQAVDGTLLGAVAAIAGQGDPRRGAERYESEHHDKRPQYQLLDPEGRPVDGGPGTQLPVDPSTVTRAQSRGQVLVSVVAEDDGTWVPRTGPDWWQALTPASGEMRVVYAAVGDRERPTVLQMAAPLESAHEVLPGLLRNLLLLAAVGVALVAVIAWRMTRKTYEPLQAVIATADDISAHSLELRVPDVWHDRTLRKLTQVLNAMIGRLQGSFEAQGRFVAAAAHELRGPLGAMRAELEVALRRPRSAEEYKEALEGALAETARLSTLAEHLLMLARYERGVGLMIERDVDLSVLLERSAREVQRATGGAVTVSVPAGLTLDADPLALERLVSNLARNGVEAGGAPVEIEARLADGGVAITVRDRGPGIPADALPHLFEPFYRADPARGRDGGTGLGLAIVKTVVDAHKGTIRVASEPGQGAAFHVWLPLKQDAEA